MTRRALLVIAVAIASCRPAAGEGGSGKATTGAMSSVPTPAEAAPNPPALDAPLRSATVLHVDGDALFVADSTSATIWSFTIPPLAPRPSGPPAAIPDVQSAVASALGVRVKRLSDLAVHTASGTAFVGVELEGRRATIARIGPTGSVEPTPLSGWSPKKIQIEDAPANDVRLWRTMPVRTFAFTSLGVHAGELYVAGVAGDRFESVLRRVPLPLGEGGTPVTARIETYHAVHNQVETRAPIRAFTFAKLAGDDYLVAAYTCTPLVLLRIRDLVDSARVRGKTVAELGFGNAPVDMFSLSVRNAKGKDEQFVLLTNTSRSAQLIRLDDLEAASNAPGLTTPVTIPERPFAGVPFAELPLGDVLELADYDAEFTLALRGTRGGGAELVAHRKGIFFRLSDFVNEYDFPTYAYPEGDRFQQEYVRSTHRLLKTDEGYADLAR